MKRIVLMACCCSLLENGFVMVEYARPLSVSVSVSVVVKLERSVVEYGARIRLVNEASEPIPLYRHDLPWGS